MTAALLTAVGGCLLLWWNPYPWVSAAGLAITGLAIAPLFPGFVSGTEQRVGARHAANTIGMQVTASGFAVFSIPGMVGVLAQRVGLEILPPFLTAIYALLFVLYRISLNQGPAGQTDGSN